MRKDKFLKMIKLIHQTDENPIVQNEINDKMFELIEELGLGDKYFEVWEYYQKMENVEFNKEGEVVGFKGWDQSGQS